MSSQLAIRELREVGASAGRRQNGKLTHGKTWILGGVDLVSLTLAYVMTYALAAKVGTLPPVAAPAWFLGLVAALGVPAWLSIFAGYGLYENDNQKISVASFDEVRDVFHAMLVGSLLLLIVSQGVRWAFGWWVYSAVEAAFFVAAALILVPVARGIIRSWVFPRVMQPRRTLLVGSGPEAQLVYRKIQSHPEYGLDVVGFLDNRDVDDAGPVLGEPDDIAQLVDELEVDRVLLASSITDHERMLALAPQRSAPGRAGLDRAAVLRDLHVARDPRRRRGNAGRHPSVDAARSELAGCSSVHSTLRLRHSCSSCCCRSCS